MNTVLIHCLIYSYAIRTFAQIYSATEFGYSLWHYTQNFAQNLCACGIFILFFWCQQIIDRSKLLDLCLKCIFTSHLNKIYNAVIVSKSMSQIKYFGIWSWSTCFPLTWGTFKILQIFYFPCKKGSSQVQDRQKGMTLLPQVCRLLSVPSGQQQTSNIWCVQPLLVTLCAPLPFLTGH